MTQVINVTVGQPEIRAVITSPTIATTFMVAGGVGPEGPTGPAGADSTVAGPIGPNGAAGVVAAVVAGTNITVNNTDPANPVVSSAAGSQWDDVPGGLNYAGGKVGIGTTSPESMLDVNLDPALTYTSQKASFGGRIILANYGSNYAGVWLISANASPSPSNYAFISDGTGMIFNSPGGGINFRKSNVDKMVISSAGAVSIPAGALTVSGSGASSFVGNVGIGTTSPTEKLDVAGNVSANSLILKSPNGTKYTLAVADDGTLSTTAV